MSFKQTIYKIWSKILRFFLSRWFATEPPKCTAQQLLDVSAIVQPGDIIMRKYYYQSTSIFLPGGYTHSGMIKDKNTVLEATMPCARENLLYNFFMHADKFIVLRPKYKDDAARKLAVITAQKFVDDKVPYDSWFDSSPEKLYCHELVVICLKSVGIDVNLTKLKWAGFINLTAYLPENILEVCDIIYKFN